jgi:hypothetical protein
MARPVCHDVQQRSRHSATVNNPGCREIRVVADLSLQGLNISAMNRCRERDGSRVIGLKAQHRIPAKTKLSA